MTAPGPLLAALVARRKALHLTQQHVADQLGVARENLSRWERGHVEMRMSLMIQYARVVGCRIVVEPNDSEMERAVAS